MTHTHEWVEITTLGELPQQLICTVCGAYSWEPFQTPELPAKDQARRKVQLVMNAIMPLEDALELLEGEGDEAGVSAVSYALELLRERALDYIRDALP